MRKELLQHKRKEKGTGMYPRGRKRIDGFTTFPQKGKKNHNFFLEQWAFDGLSYTLMIARRYCYFRAGGAGTVHVGRKGRDVVGMQVMQVIRVIRLFPGEEKRPNLDFHIWLVIYIHEVEKKEYGCLLGLRLPR